MVRIEADESPGQRNAWAKLVGTDSELTISVNRCLVGRSHDADVTLPIDSVSRRHALIWQEDATTWIYDMGSANGTFVDGVAAVDPTPVDHGSRLTFGVTPYVFHRI